MTSMTFEQPGRLCKTPTTCSSSRKQLFGVGVWMPAFGVSKRRSCQILPKNVSLPHEHDEHFSA